MAVTQYIGARYVPLFYTASDNTNNWEAGVQYEPLTIVTYLNQSYASKKPVPVSVGNPADNPDYWVITGAYNAQVAQMQQDLDDLELRVDDVEDKVKEYPAYVMIGDSYGHASGNNYGWIDQLTTKLGLTPGNTLFESAVGGYGFAVANSFNTLLTNLAGTMTDEEKASVGTILVCGGANDRGVGADTIETAITTFCTNALSAFPNAEIYVGMIAGCADGNWAGAQQPRIVAGYRTASKNPKTHYLNNVEYALHDRANLNPDLVHPTLTGYTILSNAIYAALVHGSYNYTYIHQEEMRSYDGSVLDVGAKGTYIITIEDGIANFIMNTSLGVTIPATSLNTGISVDIAQIPELSIIGTPNAYYAYNRTLTQVMALVSNGNITQNWIANVSITDEGVIKFTNRDSLGPAQSSMYTGVTRIIIPPFSFSIPAITC